MRFRVVGAGRAGRSFARALTERGWQQLGLLGRGDDPTRAAAGVDLVLVTVPDDAIAEVAARIEPAGAALVHTSGATTLEALAPHPRRASVHPLVSLPDPDTGAARLGSGATFAIAGDPVAAQLVEALGGTAIEVPDQRRPLYHAAASVAANHLVALCAQVERLAERAGVPAAAYWTLMARTLDNVAAAGPVASLTGPAARGDTATVAAHLAAIGPAEHDLYLTLADAAADLAGRPPHSPRRLPASMAPDVLTTIDELRSVLDGRRAEGRTVGFVPTMGYLHDGHGSLLRAAAAETDVVVASIFVNPLQFAPDEDLASYPRDLDRDRALAAANGAHHLFVPSVDEMYPGGPVLTSVSVADLSARWDGASRPGHFAGVATVVSKLFNIVGPCRAYFGQKDFQQLAVIRRMVADLSFPVQVVGCPIVREPDGLAMSSRNSYLSADERAAAVVLSRALAAGRDLMAGGETDPGRVADAIAATVAAEPLAGLDYAAVVDPLTLQTPERLAPPPPGSDLPSAQLLLAAQVGRTRLIDNCAATVGTGGGGSP